MPALFLASIFISSSPLSLFTQRPAYRPPQITTWSLENPICVFCFSHPTRAKPHSAALSAAPFVLKSSLTRLFILFFPPQTRLSLLFLLFYSIYLFICLFFNAARFFRDLTNPGNTRQNPHGVVWAVWLLEHRNWWLHMFWIRILITNVFSSLKFKCIYFYFYFLAAGQSAYMTTQRNWVWGI